MTRDLPQEDVDVVEREAEAVVNRWLSGLVLPFGVGDDPWGRTSLRQIEVWLRQEACDRLWGEFGLFVGAGLCRAGRGRWALHHRSDRDPTLLKVWPVIEKTDGGGIVPVMNWIAMSKDSAVPIDVADLFHDVGLAP